MHARTHAHMLGKLSPHKERIYAPVFNSIWDNEPAAVENLRPELLLHLSKTCTLSISAPNRLNISSR